MDWYKVNVVNTSDYYPFGFAMGGGRTESSGDYRYGFNGKEKDDKGEWGGEYLSSATCCDSEGNAIINYTLQKSQTYYDYGFRIYNPGIGKFLSVDPLAEEYSFYTPYHFAGNTPILARDLDGREPVVEDGYIVGYIVKKGQGPTYIMADINDPKTQEELGYTLQKKVSWEKIVINNLSKFENVVDGNGEIIDKNNGDYRWGNIRPDDFLFINGEKPKNEEERLPKASEFQNLLRELATHIDDEAFTDLAEAFGVRSGRGGLAKRWEDAEEIIHDDNFDYDSYNGFLRGLLDKLQSSNGRVEIEVDTKKVQYPTLFDLPLPPDEDVEYKVHEITTITNSKTGDTIQIDTTRVLKGRFKVNRDTVNDGTSKKVTPRYEDTGANN